MNALPDSDGMSQVKCYGPDFRAAVNKAFGSLAAVLNKAFGSLAVFFSFRAILLIVFEDRSAFARPIVLHFCNYYQQCRYCQNDQDGIWLFNGLLYFSSFFLKSSQFSFLFSLESIDASMSSRMY